MKRLRCVLVAGMVAVAVCMIGAGTAVAAKGGNSDNAHACQQGGHESRFEAETGRAFNNAGDCASHAAQGGDTAGLQIDNTSAYPLPSACTQGRHLLGERYWLRPAAGVALDGHRQHA